IVDPSRPELVRRVDVSEYGKPNSVAVRNGVVATCVASLSRDQTGRVVFLSTSGDRLKTLEVGYEPDMLKFTPDGHWLLVANEGEPLADYSFDAAGTISQIDMSVDVGSLRQDHVFTLGFEAWNDQRDELDGSIRIYGPNASVAQDLEPEYIAIAPDSRTAWVVCQENNALAIVDLEQKKVTRLTGLGFKDHRRAGNGFDASDKDDACQIQQWPVFGIYQPDAIACFTVG
ncbi:MAG: alkaline phosphatase, partial [Planctomycetaceae bacterium]|nr:alkaline phosphatase [Planctomycetaceae bacterium]